MHSCVKRFLYPRRPGPRRVGRPFLLPLSHENKLVRGLVSSLERESVCCRQFKTTCGTMPSSGCCHFCFILCTSQGCALDSLEKLPP